MKWFIATLLRLINFSELLIYLVYFLFLRLFNYISVLFLGLMHRNFWICVGLD